MSGDKTRQSAAGDENLRPISAWVRRYAQHRRGLAVVVGLLINLAIYGAIGGGAYLGGQAYRGDSRPMAVIGICGAAMGCVALLFMAFTRDGRELPVRIALRLAGDEGEANLDNPVSHRQRQTGVLMGAVFGICILAHVYFGDTIPVRYRQPVSALYSMPFLVGIWLLQRPASGYISLLWPVLYGLHAVLLSVGAPILFTGRWESMNILLPVVGYGILVNVANHLYARFAFHKVRQLANIGRTNK